MHVLKEQRSAALAAWVLALVLLSVLWRPLRAQELPFTHYTTENERNALPSAVVTDVFQDRTGFIWMAVYSSGIVRYDGRSMEVFTTSDGLASPSVWEVLQDSLGRLWVGSNDGLVVTEEPLPISLQGNRPRFTSSVGGVQLTTGRVRKNAIALDADGWLWVGTDESGILRYRADRLDQTEVDTLQIVLQETEASPGVRSIVVGRDGSVWVGLSTGRILVFKRGERRFTAINLAEEIPDEAINLLYESPDGALWAGNRVGQLLHLEGHGENRLFVPVSQALSGNILSMTSEADGALWVTSEGGGVQKLYAPETSIPSVYSGVNGFLSETVFHVMTDREGNLWFAQSGGVSKLRFNYRSVTNYSSASRRGERPALPSASVGAVAVGGSPQQPCSFWAGGSEGVACVDSDGASTYLQAEHGLRNQKVNALALDERERLWIGTVGGIHSLTFETAKRPLSAAERSVTVHDSPAILRRYWDGSVYSITTLDLQASTGGTGSTESIWFASTSHVFSLINDKWYIFGPPAGLPQVRVQSVTLDDAGRLWVATQGQGIYRSSEPITVLAIEQMASTTAAAEADGQRLDATVIRSAVFEKVWSTDQGAPSDEVYQLLSFNGKIWAATTAGVAVIDADPVRTAAILTDQDGLGSSFAVSMAHAPEAGSLWVGTNYGLAHVDVEAQRVVRNLTRQSGFIGDEVWFIGSVKVGEDGRVYFGTSKGLTVYDPEEDRHPTVEPLLYLVGSQKEEGLSSNAISFEFVALSFADEKRIRYRTRLAGYENEWSAPTEDSKVRYMNLPAFLSPKQYALEVTTRAADDTWLTPPLTHAFELKPFVWFRWWTFAIYVLLMGGSIFAVLMLQERRNARKDRERAQERELAHAREIKEAYYSLDLAHRRLKTTQAQLVHQEKMASLGQLTAGIAHEIKNPLNFVTNFASLSKELCEELLEAQASGNHDVVEEITRDLIRNVSKIDEHGRRADSIVRSMMQHARGSSAGREPIDLKTFLEEYISLAYHGKRAATPDFNIEIERYLDDDIGEVELVAQDIGRVLVNLLGNAFDAVQEKVQSGDETYDARVRVSARRIDGEIEIRVSDNGPGIPEHIRTKVFEPFFTTKPTGSGTGLGLSLSHDIVTQGHGGTLAVESASGEGATFIVRLPANFTAAETLATGSEPAEEVSL